MTIGNLEEGVFELGYNFKILSNEKNGNDNNYVWEIICRKVKEYLLAGRLNTAVE
jgi:hypothetical protein